MTTLKRTEHGFEFGSATVSALASHQGIVFIGIATPKGKLQVRVTKTGKVRVFAEGMELIPEALSSKEGAA